MNMLLDTMNDVRVFGLHETDDSGFTHNGAVGICAHGKTAVYWVESPGLDIYLQESFSVLGVLWDKVDLKGLCVEEDLWDKGFLDDCDELDIDRVVEYLASLPDKPGDKQLSHKEGRLIAEWVLCDSAKEVAEKMGVTVSTVGRLVRKLRKDGWDLPDHD